MVGRKRKIRGKTSTAHQKLAADGKHVSMPPHSKVGKTLGNFTNEGGDELKGGKARGLDTSNLKENVAEDAEPKEKLTLLPL